MGTNAFFPVSEVTVTVVEQTLVHETILLVQLALSVALAVLPLALVLKFAGGIVQLALPVPVAVLPLALVNDLALVNELALSVGLAVFDLSDVLVPRI